MAVLDDVRSGHQPDQAGHHSNKGDRHPNQASPMIEAKRLMQLGQISEATPLIETQLVSAPEDINALYMMAVCQRYLQDPRAAMKTLDRLLTLDQRFARAWQEQGHLFKLTGDMDKAAGAYAKAVELNPALVASWTGLADLYSSSGDLTGAREAHRHATELRALPAELLSVASMMHAGETKKAEALCRHFLQDNPQHVEGMRLLAELGTRAGILDDAEFLLESALVFRPSYLAARFDYVNILLRRQKFAKAFDEAAVLVSQEPDNVSFSVLQVNACMGVGRFDEAIALCQRALSERPDSAMIHMIHGHALKTIGKGDEAIAAYRQAYTLRPDFGDAYWSLANLKTYRFTRAEIAAMERMLDSEAVAVVDRYHMCFSLGKAHEDLADYAIAFARFHKGNELKRATLAYKASRLEKRLRLQKETFTPDFVSNRSGCGFPDPAPIFIVGLPRAGSTLLEQILASHSLVDGTLELSNMPAIAQRLNGRMNAEEEPRYPRIVAEKTAADLHELGRTYIEETHIQRRGAPFFIDKMPNNFAHVGLICLTLPNAKIIDARRDPMACGFSCFKQLFAEGQEFSYGLEDIARYYNSYVDLMAYWDHVFPGRILRVQHEDVVTDLESAVRRILAFCDLAFQEDCLAFHTTQRSVRTASSEQVRQPIYQSGLDQWKKYADYLEPLRQALDPPTHKYELPLGDPPVQVNH